MNLDAPNGHIHRSAADHPEPRQSDTSTRPTSGERHETARSVPDDTASNTDQERSAGSPRPLGTDAPVGAQAQRQAPTAGADRTEHTLARTETPATTELPVEQLSASERMTLVEQTHPRSATTHSQQASESGDRAESTAPERMTHLEQHQRPQKLLRSATVETTDAPSGKLPRGPDGIPDDDAASARSGTETTTTGVETAQRDAEHPGTRDIPSRRAIQDACKKWGVDTDEGHAAVQRSYDFVKNRVAPLLVKNMARMIDDCNAEVLRDPDRLYAFLGRDGYCLAAVVATLDPELYVKHCVTVPVTRLMLEPALQDDEKNAGKKFGIDAFRKYKDVVSADEVHEAKFRLTAHLEDYNLPVTEAGRNITVIDTSRKGSTQEGLAALYPQNNWFGRYLFFEQSPEDPHPDTKTGYALNNTLSPDDRSGAAAPRELDSLAEDRQQTFAHPDAILSVEDLVHGPWPSPRLGADGRSRPQAEVPPMDELNPLDISPAFQDPATRIAAAEAMVVAVRDCAYEVVRQRDAGKDWCAELDNKTELLVDDLRSWISGREVDDDMAEVLGAFVRRSDRPHVAELRAAITANGLDAATAKAVWQGYKQAGTLSEKQDYVAEYTRAMEKS